MTLGELVNAEKAFGRVNDWIEKQPARTVSAKTSYHISKLLRLIGAETAHFHKEHERLVREFGLADATGNISVASAPLDRQQEFVKQLNTVALVEVKIDWSPIQLGELDAVKITPGDCIALGEFVTEDVPAAK